MGSSHSPSGLSSNSIRGLLQSWDRMGAAKAILRTPFAGFWASRIFVCCAGCAPSAAHAPAVDVVGVPRRGDRSRLAHLAVREHRRAAARLGGGMGGRRAPAGDAGRPPADRAPGGGLGGSSARGRLRPGPRRGGDPGDDRGRDAAHRGADHPHRAGPGAGRCRRRIALSGGALPDSPRRPHRRVPAPVARDRGGVGAGAPVHGAALSAGRTTAEAGRRPRRQGRGDGGPPHFGAQAHGAAPSRRRAAAAWGSSSFGSPASRAHRGRRRARPSASCASRSTPPPTRFGRRPTGSPRGPSPSRGCGPLWRSSPPACQSRPG